jgi:tRNA pseudouridine38-40 synthase
MTLFDNDEPAAPSSEGPPLRVRLTVAYDGTDFHGFAVQDGGVRTVGGALSEALSKVLRQKIELTCAGRTDAGVHARGQVVSFDVAGDTELDLVRLTKSVNSQLGPEVVARDAAVVEGFDARHDAKQRRYRYTVVNAPVPDPFLARVAWWVADPLDVRAMNLACDALLGEHDFASFCRRPNPSALAMGATTMRRVDEAEWIDEGDGVLQFWIEAGAFCHQMVRSIVGELVEIGRGRRKASDVGRVLRARDRALAAQPAPPHGLCLWSVKY